MHFPGVVIIGTGASSLPNDDTSQLVFVEVVLIDKTHHMGGGENSPHVYQVHEQPLDEDLGSSSGEIARQLDEDAFVMIGEIKNIDKSSRRLYLGNGTIVVYKHLIIAAGSRHTYVGHDNIQEFRSGIQALAEALRLRQTYLQQVMEESKERGKVFTQLSTPYFSAKKASCDKGEIGELESVLRDLMKCKLDEKKAGRAIGDQMHKVFCEVQVAPVA